MPRKGIMLCYPFEEARLAKWAPPYIVQPKLDGERCRALHTERGWLLLSSEEHIFWSVPHIVEDLQRTDFPVGTELDGELYHHGWTFEQIHSICSRTKNLHPDYKKIGYAIFDLVNEDNQTGRLVELMKHSLNGSLYKVRHYLAVSLEEVLLWYEEFRKQGYEGIVIRHFAASHVRKRSTFLMKFKPKRADVYTIVGYKEEVSIHGEPKGRLGSLEVIGDDGTPFNVGSGLDDGARKILWDFRGSIVGLKVKVKYQHKTAKGVPRFPVFVEILKNS